MTKEDEHLTLLDEEGQEHSFEVIDVLQVNENDYAILLPVEGELDGATEDDEAIIFRIVDEGDENQTLMAVEDEGEWEQVAAAWEDKVGEIEEQNLGEVEDEEEDS